MITSINKFKNYLIKESSKFNINENFDISTLVAALSDLDERRPNRMKKITTDPRQRSSEWSGRGGQRDVYIQDEACSVMQDKYGRVRGEKMWEDSIGEGARGGAMFSMATLVMIEKQALCDALRIHMNDYWQYSYFSLWKAWMTQIGQPIKIDSDEQVEARKQAKIEAERIVKQTADDARRAEHKRKFDSKLEQFKNKFSSIDIMNVVADAKDKERIDSI